LEGFFIFLNLAVFLNKKTRKNKKRSRMMRTLRDSRRLEELVQDYGVSLDLAQGFVSMERKDQVVRDAEAREAVEKFFGLEDQEEE
jgi:hypothetical protein